MSTIEKGLKYTLEHEWVRDQGDGTGVCGITDHAQEMLTDIVFVELPETGMEISAGEQVAVVESVKAVSDVFSPVSGTVVEVNTELEDAPELINTDPYAQGWIFRIQFKDTAELDSLMDPEEYTRHVEAGEK